MPSQRLSERPAVSSTATRREFRAATLEAAVELATAELGPDIRIVEANRIRRGGVGGFFATDLGVEVVVEQVPAHTRADTPDDLIAEMRRLGIDVDGIDGDGDARSAAPTNLDALIDDVQRAERSFAARAIRDDAGRATRAPSFGERLASELRSTPPAQQEVGDLPRRRGEDLRLASDHGPGHRSLSTGADTTTLRRPSILHRDAATAPKLAPRLSTTTTIATGTTVSRLGGDTDATADAATAPRLMPRLRPTGTPIAATGATADVAPTAGAMTGTSSAATMAAHLRAIAHLTGDGLAPGSDDATSDPASAPEPSVIAADPAAIAPEAAGDDAPESAESTGTTESTGTNATGTNEGETEGETERLAIATDLRVEPTGPAAATQRTEPGAGIAAEAARSMMAELARLDAEQQRPADLRRITVSVWMPDGGTVSIAADLGEVAP